MSATYWNRTGRHMAVIEQLHALIPTEGAVASPRKNPKLEKLRRAINCYYDLYNNGLCNRASEFARVTGIAASRHKQGYGRYSPQLYTLLEERMDAIIADAAAEQNIELTTQLALDI